MRLIHHMERVKPNQIASQNESSGLCFFLDLFGDAFSQMETKCYHFASNETEETDNTESEMLQA